MQRIIGLTGSIACGKSTVVAWLRGLGAHTIDADAVTHALQQPGQPVYDEIVAAFGTDILSAPAGPIDRRRLGAVVFADPAALRRLEQIVHPAVRHRITAWLAELASTHPSAVAVIDAVKLLEGGWRDRCTAVWLVVCDPQQQFERLVARRGLTPEEARARLAAQPPEGPRRAAADVVIENSGTLEATHAQVVAAFRAFVSTHPAGPGPVM